MVGFCVYQMRWLFSVRVIICGLKTGRHCSEGFFFLFQMLMFKHSSYHSHFLRFIASTSGLEALHFSRSTTLLYAPLRFLLSLPLSLTLTHTHTHTHTHNRPLPAYWANTKQTAPSVCVWLWGGQHPLDLVRRVARPNSHFKNWPGCLMLLLPRLFVLLSRCVCVWVCV